MQDVGRLAKRALFKLVLNCCYTTSVTRCHGQWPPCHASAEAVRSLIIRSGQDPNSADFMFGKKVVRSVTFLLISVTFCICYLQEGQVQQPFICHLHNGCGSDSCPPLVWSR
jgi:hypothetical protein